jgi:hypothetical protein
MRLRCTPGRRMFLLDERGIEVPAEMAYVMGQAGANRMEDVTHITLVHGTFAPGADWTQPGSPLRNKIAEEFEGRVEFHSDFRWRGLPSHIDRHTAGKRFRSYMLDLTARHPGRHFIIGHSHGGLVSLYAVRDQELAKRIEGVISLSTPYLIARPRELSVLGMIAAGFGCVAFVGMILILARVAFAVYLDFGLAWWLGIPIFAAGLASPMLALGTLAGIVPGVEKLSTWFLETMRIPRIHSERLLIVRGPSDEASALLSLFHGLELLATAIWGRRGPFDRAIVAVAQHVWVRCQAIWSVIPLILRDLAKIWLLAGALISIAVSFACGVLMYKFPQETLELQRAAWVPFRPLAKISEVLSITRHYASVMLPGWSVATFAVVAVPFFALFCVGGVLASFAVGVGFFLGLVFVAAVFCAAILAITSVPELGPCVARVVVSVEALPRGGYKVEQGDDTADLDAFLTHSWSYAHPQALAAIATWLKAPKPDAPLIPPPPKKSDRTWTGQERFDRAFRRSGAPKRRTIP